MNLNIQIIFEKVKQLYPDLSLFGNSACMICGTCYPKTVDDIKTKRDRLIIFDNENLAITEQIPAGISGNPYCYIILPEESVTYSEIS